MVIRDQCISSGVLLHTHNSLQASVSLRRYTAKTVYLQYGSVDRMASL